MTVDEFKANACNAEDEDVISGLCLIWLRHLAERKLGKEGRIATELLKLYNLLVSTTSWEA